MADAGIQNFGINKRSVTVNFRTFLMA
jgi:hypothetical protein